MKGATQNIDLSIKKPKQSRAKLTVSLIFGAVPFTCC